MRYRRGYSSVSVPKPAPPLELSMGQSSISSTPRRIGRSRKINISSSISDNHLEETSATCATAKSSSPKSPSLESSHYTSLSLQLTPISCPAMAKSPTSVPFQSHRIFTDSKFPRKLEVQPSLSPRRHSIDHGLPLQNLSRSHRRSHQDYLSGRETRLSSKRRIQLRRKLSGRPSRHAVRETEEEDEVQESDEEPKEIGHKVVEEEDDEEERDRIVSSQPGHIEKHLAYRLRPRRSSVLPSLSVSPPHVRKRVRIESPTSFHTDSIKRQAAQAEEEEDEEDDNLHQQRRYPMRNRRHTTVYQATSDYHHNHSRDWLAGTGFKEPRRKRRRDSHRMWPRNHEDSTTSSSSSDGCCTREAPMKSLFTGSAGNTNNIVDLDELRFERRLSKSILHSRSELMPINIKPRDLESGTLRDRLVAGSSLADIEPMVMDTDVTFDEIGGHKAQIRALQESVLLPLVYPEVFEGFAIEPPRGVLFHGPPGTGKTLLARALANECSRMAASTDVSQPLTQRARPIAFFMRKGADCLSKWVGESERQLRLLFDQAYRMRPSIIFFDEIDGLAPVRSSRQDQIHSSIVSTLLSLMDGLDRRAEVVVIGATNRPDAIDPALRRPGRFDREFSFTLPNEPVRRRILEIHTARWTPLPAPQLLDELARLTVGFCGADLKGLATEACLCCLRRQYPQVYESKVKLKLDRNYLVVDQSDWLQALRLLRPASLRLELDSATASSPAAIALASTSRRPLLKSIADDTDLQPNGPLHYLLLPVVEQLTQRIARALSSRQLSANIVEGSVEPHSPFAVGRVFNKGQAGVLSITSFADSPALISQVLVDSNVPASVFPAVWRRLESVEVYTVTLACLLAASASGDSCIVTSISQLICSAQRCLADQRDLSYTASSSAAGDDIHTPLSQIPGVILYLPRIDSLLANLPSVSLAVYFVERLIDLTTNICATSYSVAGRRRLLLVATYQRLRTNRCSPPESPVSKTSPLTVRVQTPVISPRVSLCNGHASQNVVVRLTDQMDLVNQTRGRKLSTSVTSLNKSSRTTANEVTHSPAPVITTSGQRRSLWDTLPHLPAFMYHQQPPCLSQPPLLRSPGSDSLDGEDISLADHITSHRRNSSISDCLRRLFRFPFVEIINFETNSAAQREQYFRPVLLDSFGMNVTTDKSGADKPIIQSRPPTPQPLCDGANSSVVEALANRTLNETEIVELRNRSESLHCQLRIFLRRVVAQLGRDRRFAVFTRPVQEDEAPDYHEVIATPMDLGIVRDKIDAREYSTINSFKSDVRLIYDNALEYNPPNVPRSREIRARAFEFWDAVCMLLKEVDPPNLDELCSVADRACELYSQTSAIVSNIRNTPLDDVGLTETFRPPPMPVGLRYSRRLHGVKPDDIEPRSTNVSPVSPKSPPSSPLLFHDQHAQPNCLSNLFTITGDSAHPRISATGGEASRGKRSRRTSSSTSIRSLDTETVALPKESPASGKTTCPASVSIPVCANLDNILQSTQIAMGSFLLEVVHATHAWSVDQLAALHCDLFEAVRAVHTLTETDISSFCAQLSSILRRHQAIIVMQMHTGDSSCLPSLSR